MSAQIETAARQPRLVALAREQAWILWQRHQWELLNLGLLLLAFLVQVTMRLEDVIRDQEMRVMMQNPWLEASLSDFSYPLLLVGLYWGLALWRGEARGRREYLFSTPEASSHALLMRVRMGGYYLLVVILAAWFIWIIALRVRNPILETNLPLDLLPSLGWWSIFLGGLNAFLLASLGALLSRDPVRWIVLWLPLVVALLAIGALVLRWTPLILPATVVLPPWGLLGGLGIPLWEDNRGTELLPAGAASLVWFGILMGAVILAARWRRQVA